MHLDLGVQRFGGVVHAVRTAAAIGIPTAVAYLAPSYLHDDLEQEFTQLGVAAASIGSVAGSPGVMLVRDSTEAGPQWYGDILAGRRTVTVDGDAVRQLVDRFHATDVLVFPGPFPPDVVAASAADRRLRVHLDTQYADDAEAWLTAYSPLATVFVSTTSPLFVRAADADPARIVKAAAAARTNALVLKEGRGGSRLYRASTLTAEAPAYLGQAVHSVGVGDAFDVAWIVARDDDEDAPRLRRASFYAATYASTTHESEFGASVAAARERDAEIVTMRGSRLPWESRGETHIYLAAPDFDGVDTRVLDELDAALRYQHLVPHRPVREVGGASSERSKQELARIYAGDLELLEQAAALVAVPIFDDPGTYAELGWMARAQRPTVLLSPAGRPVNFFVARTATRVCNSVPCVVEALFELLGRDE